MKKINKSVLSTLGLLLITVWAAVQYLFYSNVPEDTSTFAFIFITNLCGCVLLSLTQFSHLKKIGKGTIKKAAVLSIIQLVFNFFLILGSQNMDSVVISSVSALYFIFVAPLLLLLRKRVSFRSGVATLIAVIALLLVFNANIEGVFSSPNVIFLIIADVFFAGFVVAISIMTEGEDPQAISIVQMASCSLFSLLAWVVEVKVFGHGSLALSREPAFWISVLFIGIFIRALYSVIQFAAQKNVPPVNASLIFSSEIVITLILNPFLSKAFGTPYEPVTVFQVIGCILFVIAVLVCDDEFMKKFHYNDMDTTTVIDEDGKEIQQISLSRKIVNMNLLIGLGALIFSTVVCLLSIFTIRNTVIDTTSAFGNNASMESQIALMEQVESELSQKAKDKAAVATAKLEGNRNTVQYAAYQAGKILSNPKTFEKVPVKFPHVMNGGTWTMQMTLSEESISEDDVREQNEALGNMKNLFESIHQNNSDLISIYIGTEEGLLISYDPNSNLSEAYGTPLYYEHRESGWYTKAKTMKRAAFTDTYLDGAGRGLTITCFAPIYYDNGRFAGAIGMDFLQNKLNEQLVNVGITEPEKAVLVSSDGIVIATTGESVREDRAVSIRDKEADLPLSPIADQIITDKTGLLVTGSESESDGYYVAFDKVDVTGWKLCIISPVENIIAPAVKIRDNIEGNTEKIGNTVSDGVRTIIACCLIFFAVIVLTITFLVGRLSEKITDPLKHLEQDVKEISQGNFNQRTTVNTQDEIGSLARAFNGMTANLQKYIVDLTEATAREQRVSSELSLAQQIQADALPSEYPAFPDRKEFDLFFLMQPAKEVGGDFYDFFLIDESHLALLIADVSGKGVPAALFMMVSKMLIKNRALVGGTPSEILEFANNQLCENNKVEMFVTAWLGILDLKTGILTAANAGHEFPVIRHGDGEFELFTDRHGFVLAGIPGSRYRDYTIQLKPKDMLFVYTDGVAEANDVYNELFGVNRMLNSLNTSGEKDCVKIINSMLESIKEFAGEAPQFDDITMLCLRLDRLMEE